MNIELWLEQYGYLAVFCGVLLEGPFTLATAGFLAHQDYLNVFGVLAAAFTATFLVIELAYFVGMIGGRYFLARRPAWQKNYARFAGLLEKYKVLFLLSFRFFAGAHTIAPMAIGMARIKPLYFSVMNAVSAAVWTMVFFLIGYVFGHAFENVLEDIKRHEKTLVLVLVALLIIYYLARRLIWRRSSAMAAE